ncbi:MULTISPECIES: VOC family protein [Sinorhizobium]|uniref:Glyoxalase/bleomycin resistance protein/dioxygenase family protein n=1 Tax=Rhizobium fredii TaxID=380 RepID=A0A2L0H468_RHIFR|nr:MULTISPECIES: VOC family protein [Sinorhizobium]ASY55658.1 Lactoylglutathione lyase-related lyase [Sinorhizobium sp. CCBAU 05631]AUX75589.1 glyoxalase/bleomycin resistance protein/dioxygenase family protein [Sinorhizobium fredii]PDT52319.1 VOC family protein [Sinorhizobium sp. NG07B]POH28052.1 lactoylglutathione lyase [Sinorhizobium americanum]
MEFHQGRLIDHVHLRVEDLAVSKRFYQAVLGALGHRPTHETDAFFAFDEFFVDQADDYRTRVHIAFQASGPDAVQRFYDVGLANGGTDNGAPGERPYHPGYFAAFLLDPDGNNIEAVHHGPTTRSAADVVVRPVET